MASEIDSWMLGLVKVDASLASSANAILATMEGKGGEEARASFGRPFNILGAAQSFTYTCLDEIWAKSFGDGSPASQSVPFEVSDAICGYIENLDDPFLADEDREYPSPAGLRDRFGEAQHQFILISAWSFLHAWTLRYGGLSNGFRHAGSPGYDPGASSEII
jgi:hypothetical protein